MSNETDDMPLHLRIKVVLRDYPKGLSTKELAQITDRDQQTVSAVVSKIYSYGGGIEKIGPPFGAGTRWRLREATQPRPSTAPRI